MKLDTIKTQTTWSDAAASLNSNYSKIALAIERLSAYSGDEENKDALIARVKELEDALSTPDTDEDVEEVWNNIIKG